MTGQRLRFGVFLPPYHAVEENPHLALHRDLWLAEHLDRLGYDELWIGEHHSAAFETIGVPEMFIATAAERTKHIRLGTGVVSLPYHPPLMLAERINYLDHVTRGRVMFGVGPGALPSDAMMQGIPVESLRPRMDEAVGVLIRLLSGEVVTEETEWFTLKDARLQMLPYSQPRVEMAVASLVSPSGATAAGKHGLGMLSFQALGKDAFKSLASNWAMAEQVAAKHGKSVDRAGWRLVIQVHLAETKEQAIRDCGFGLEPWIGYFRDVAQLPILPDGLAGEDMVRTYADLDVAVIGTPDDAIATIEKLIGETGGFGCLMLLAHNWADTAATAKSYELFARYVVPHFQRLNVNRQASMEWVMKVRGELAAQTQVALEKRFAQHAAESGEGG